MSKNSEKHIENLKTKYVSAYIDQICNESEKLTELVDMSDKISMNPISTRLFSYLLIAHAEEDYLSVARLKEEMILFVDIS